MRNKAYATNKKKVKSFLKLSGVRLTYKTTDKSKGEEGLYSFTRKEVTIFREESWTFAYEFAVILHEVGHYLSDQYRPNLFDRVTYHAYDRYSKGQEMSQQQKNRVIKIERLAWHYGECLARQLGIRLPNGFKALKISHINSLKNSIKVKSQ